MAFIPGEDVHRSLVDLLNPFAAERLKRTGFALAFYSLELCESQDDIENIALRRFKDRLDESSADYSSLQYSHIRQPSELGVPAPRLALDVTVDFSTDDQTATQAHQLGFADEHGFVVARLAPRREDLNLNGLYEKVIGLKDLIDSSEPPQDAVVKFIERELTVPT